MGRAANVYCSLHMSIFFFCDFASINSFNKDSVYFQFELSNRLDFYKRVMD